MRHEDFAGRGSEIDDSAVDIKQDREVMQIRREQWNDVTHRRPVRRNGGAGLMAGSTERQTPTVAYNRLIQRWFPRNSAIAHAEFAGVAAPYGSESRLGYGELWLKAPSRRRPGALVR